MPRFLWNLEEHCCVYTIPLFDTSLRHMKPISNFRWLRCNQYGKIPQMFHTAMHNISMPKMFTLPNVTQRRLVAADVSLQPVGPIFEVQQFSPSTAWPLEMGPTGCHETSVTNYRSSQCNIPELRSHYVAAEVKSQSHVFNSKKWYKLNFILPQTLCNKVQKMNSVDPRLLCRPTSGYCGPICVERLNDANS
jgi:hypothetical protein